MADIDIPIKVFQWIVGTLIAILTSFGSFFLRQIFKRLDKLEFDMAIRNEKLSVLEVQFQTVAARLDRIEGKLDLLLENRCFPKRSP